MRGQKRYESGERWWGAGGGRASSIPPRGTSHALARAHLATRRPPMAWRAATEAGEAETPPTTVARAARMRRPAHHDMLLPVRVRGPMPDAPYAGEPAASPKVGKAPAEQPRSASVLGAGARMWTQAGGHHAMLLLLLSPRARSRQCRRSTPVPHAVADP